MPTRSTKSRHDKLPPLPAWARVDKTLVDIWRFPIADPDKLPPKIRTQSRQTQTGKTDLPFRVLREENGAVLIKLADETFSWLPASNLNFLPEKNYWQARRLAPRGKLTRLPRPSASELRRALTKFKNSPYVWGGNSPAGLDCSAFTQRVVASTTGLLLPRNSRNQRRCGVRVSIRELSDLDLVFLVHRVKSLSHVGVYFEKKIWHLCLDKRGLTRETLAELKKRYRVVSARRLLV